MIKNLAHPRKRSVSVGPQSAADAYETLAYRNRRRRESINSLDGAVPEATTWSPSNTEKEKEGLELPQYSRDNAPLGVNQLPTPAASRVHSYEHIMGTSEPKAGSYTPPETDGDFSTAMQSPIEAENEKREIFMKLTKPRVRYDVEVVTKLIVYTGNTDSPPNMHTNLDTNNQRDCMVFRGVESDLVRIAWTRFGPCFNVLRLNVYNFVNMT
jgi:hypothetical protein